MIKKKSYHSSLKISSIAVKLGPLTHSLCANQSNEYIVKSACMGHGACGHLYVIYGIHGSENEYRDFVLFSIRNI